MPLSLHKGAFKKNPNSGHCLVNRIGLRGFQAQVSEPQILSYFVKKILVIVVKIVKNVL